MNRRARPSEKRIEAAIAEAAEAFKVSPDDIRSASRRAPIVKARWAVWATLVDAGFGYSAIARAWPCDHTSIVNAMQRLSEQE